MVFVRGDTDLVSNTCSINSVPAFYYGIYSDSTILASNNISLDVPNGTARKFILVGMHVDTNFDCYFFTRNAPYYRGLERTSKMYYLGASRPVDIVPSDQAIKIDLTPTLDLRYGIEQCDWLGTRADGPRPVDHLEVTADTNSFGGNIDKTVCAPVRIQSKDSLGENTNFNYDYTYALVFSGTVGTYVNSFVNYKSCTDNSSPATSFTMQNKTELVRWVRPNPSTGPILNTEILPNYLVPIGSSSVSITNLDYAAMSLASATTVVPLAYVAKTIAGGTCTPIDVSMHSLDWSGYASANSAAITISSIYPASGTVDYFSDSGCSTFLPGYSVTPGVSYNTTSVTIASDPTSRSFRTIYAKTGGFVTDSNIEQSIYSTGQSSTYYTKILGSLAPISSGGGGYTTGFSLNMEGPTQFTSGVGGGTAKCLGPFKTSLLFYWGGEAEAGSIGTVFDLDVSFDSTVLEYYLADPLKAPCDATTQQSTGYHFNFGGPGVRNSQLFYLKLKDGLSGGFQKTQYFYVNSTNPGNSSPDARRGVLQLNFNVDNENTTEDQKPAPLMRTGSDYQNWF